MHTIAALEKEIMMQLDFVQKFVPQKTLSASKQRKTIFCGTGDSFASSQLAKVFSKFRVRAHDPLDLIKNKEISAGADPVLHICFRIDCVIQGKEEKEEDCFFIKENQLQCQFFHDLLNYHANL